MTFAEAKTQSTLEAICLNRLAWAMDCFNAPKTCSLLTRITGFSDENREADCCLGRACRYLNLSRTEDDFRIVWAGMSTFLPYDAQQQLGIDKYGQLSGAGRKRANEFFQNSGRVSSHVTLADINDGFLHADDTLSRMSALLCWLWACEYLNGETIFI